MSGSDLVDLADHMVNAGDSGTMDSRQIRDACRDSVDAGYIDASDVNYDLGKW